MLYSINFIIFYLWFFVFLIICFVLFLFTFTCFEFFSMNLFLPWCQFSRIDFQEGKKKTFQKTLTKQPIFILLLQSFPNGFSSVLINSWWSATDNYFNVITPQQWIVIPYTQTSKNWMQNVQLKTNPKITV